MILTFEKPFLGQNFEFGNYHSPFREANSLRVKVCRVNFSKEEMLVNRNSINKWLMNSSENDDSAIPQNIPWLRWNIVRPNGFGWKINCGSKFQEIPFISDKNYLVGGEFNTNSYVVVSTPPKLSFFDDGQSSQEIFWSRAWTIW